MDAVAPSMTIGKPQAYTTAGEILAWVQKARAGERLVYQHFGKPELRCGAQFHGSNSSRRLTGCSSTRRVKMAAR